MNVFVLNCSPVRGVATAYITQQAEEVLTETGHAVTRASIDDYEIRD